MESTFIHERGGDNLQSASHGAHVDGRPSTRPQKQRVSLQHIVTARTTWRSPATWPAWMTWQIQATWIFNTNGCRTSFSNRHQPRLTHRTQGPTTDGQHDPVATRRSSGMKRWNRGDIGSVNHTGYKTDQFIHNGVQHCGIGGWVALGALGATGSASVYLREDDRSRKPHRSISCLWCHIGRQSNISMNRATCMNSPCRLIGGSHF